MVWLMKNSIRQWAWHMALAFVASLALAMPATAQTWHRADTRNFVVYSDGSARTLEQFARRAEMFDALFRLYFGLASEPPANRLTIYMLEDADTVTELAGDRGNLAGFYQPTSEGSFAVAMRQGRRDETALSGQAVLFHEYVHHLMARYFTFGYPAWYREGFAEYFATATFRDNGNWTLGAPANYRAIGLRHVDIPLEAVLFGDLETMNSAQRDAYYGRSWLMVHMFANDEARKVQLTDYLDRVGRGDDPQQAFAATFGDVDELSRQLDDYMDGRLPLLVSQQPIAIAGTVTVTQLTGLDGQLVPLELERRVGNQVQAARDALAVLAQDNQEHLPTLVELARAEFELAMQAQEPDFTAAAAATQAILARDPANGPANLLAGRITMGRHRADQHEGKTDWAAVRAQLDRARQADPADPLPLSGLYETYMLEGEQPPVEVVNGLGNALRMAPEATDIRVQLAYAIANEGLYDDAIRLVETLASDPHSGGVGRELVDHLRSLSGR